MRVREEARQRLLLSVRSVGLLRRPCGKSKGLKLCGKGRVARLCGAECVHRIWPVHRPCCKQWARALSATASGAAESTPGS